METKKIKKAWKEFEAKITSLRKQQADILTDISRKLDQKHLEIIRGKLKK